MGDPSSPLPPIGGEPLVGKRKQKTSLPPKGGEVLSLQKGRESKEKGGKGEETVVLAAASKSKPPPKKPVVTSNVMIVGPTKTSKTQIKKIQRIEKEMAQLQEQLEEKTQALDEIRGGKQPASAPKKVEARPQAQQQTASAAEKKGRTPTNPAVPNAKRTTRAEAGKSAPVPSRALVAPEETYAMVVRKRRSKGAVSAPTTLGGTISSQNSPKTPVALSKSKIKKRKPPKTAAVIVTCQTGIVDIIREAQSKFCMTDLGIDNTRTRKTMNGSFMIEIPGPDKEVKADKLESKLREVIGREGIRISRPTMMTELRVRDIDISLTAGEGRNALAIKGQCTPELVQVGPIRRTPNGMGTMWIKCPLVSANKMVETGRVRVGWTSLRVE